MNPNDAEEHITKILGFGLDPAKGHIRVTEAEDYKVMLGSEQTHEEMLEVLQNIQVEANKKGKEIHDLSREEFMEIVKEIPWASSGENRG